LGYVIFRGGRKNLKAGDPPRNWCIFALDAVIPWIDLDPEHKAVRFRGRLPKYYLYFLRAFGLVLVFVAVKFISQSVFLGS